MKTIYKYQIELDKKQSIELPMGADILTVQMQKGYTNGACIWAMVNPDASKIERYFEIYGTGWALPENMDSRKYIGTFQEPGYVWHLFEVTGLIEHLIP